MKLLNFLKRSKKVLPKKEHCVLLVESETSRIVQRTHYHLFSDLLIIARERFSEGEWRVTSYLYTGQCETIERYQSHFNWEEAKPAKRAIGETKQFKC